MPGKIKSYTIKNISRAGLPKATIGRNIMVLKCMCLTGRNSYLRKRQGSLWSRRWIKCRVIQIRVQTVSLLLES